MVPALHISNPGLGCGRARSLLNHMPPFQRPKESKRHCNHAHSWASSPAPGPHAFSSPLPDPWGGGWGQGVVGHQAWGHSALALGGWFRGSRGNGCRGACTGGDRLKPSTGTSLGSLGASPAGVGGLPKDGSPFLLHLLVHSVLFTSWPPVSGGFPSGSRKLFKVMQPTVA